MNITKTLATKVFTATLDTFKDSITNPANSFNDEQKNELNAIIEPAYSMRNMKELSSALEVFGKKYEEYGGNADVLYKGLLSISKHKVK